MKNNVVLRNIISSLIQQVFVLIYGLIVPILIIKEFGSEINGLVSSITQFVSYIILLEAGIGPVIKAALFKPLVEKDEAKIGKILAAASSFFKKISYIFIIYIIVLCFVYPNIVDFDFVFTISLIIIISLGKFFEYYLGMTYKLFLQADQKNYFIDYIITFTYALNLILIIVLIKLGCNIQIIKLTSSLVYILRPVILKIYYTKNYSYKIKKDKNYSLPQKWDGLYHHFASVVQKDTDIVILTIFSNLINVSIYSIYSLVINGIGIVITSLTNGIDSFFGKIIVNGKTDVLKKRFDIYSLIFYTITTILMSCTLILIIPFIEIYTSGINDANYIHEVFAYILVFAQFVFCIRYPYSTIVYAKGHFKQTKNFSLLEPIVNILLSILFVYYFGLIGVALGTLFSMFIRSFGFIIYGTKHILKCEYKESFKIIIISFLEMILIFIIHLLNGNYFLNNYINWCIYAIIIFVIVTTFVLCLNYIFFKETFCEILKIVRKRK